jgi:hypothetical protein
MPNSKPSRNAEYLSNAQLSQASSPKIADSIPRRPNSFLPEPNREKARPIFRDSGRYIPPPSLVNQPNDL